jgi:hypothetical protein
MKIQELLSEQEVDSKEFKSSVRKDAKEVIKKAIKSSGPRWQLDQRGDIGLQYLGDDPDEARKVIDNLVFKLIQLFKTKYQIRPKKSERSLPGGLKQVVYTVSPKVEFFHKKEIGRNPKISEFGLLISR